MVCENCLGIILISVSCLIIGILLIEKYFEVRNKFTLYMIIFFFATGLGFFIWFLSTDLVFDIYNEIENILLIIGLLPQMVLLYFILAVYEVYLPIRVVLIVLSALFSILYLFVPFLDIYFFVPGLKLYPVISSIIYIANIILFILNWRTNNDLKSLFFSIGLTLNLIAMISGEFSQFIQGVLLILNSLVWIVGYSGLLKRLDKLRKKD